MAKWCETIHLEQVFHGFLHYFQGAHQNRNHHLSEDSVGWQEGSLRTEVKSLSLNLFEICKSTEGVPQYSNGGFLKWGISKTMDFNTKMI